MKITESKVGSSPPSGADDAPVKLIFAPPPPPRRGASSPEPTAVPGGAVAEADLTSPSRGGSLARGRFPRKLVVVVLLPVAVLAAAVLLRQRWQVALLSRTLSSPVPRTTRTITKKSTTLSSSTTTAVVNNSKVAVVLWPSWTDGGVETNVAATRHVWRDGLQESPWLDPIIIGGNGVGGFGRHSNNRSSGVGTGNETTAASTTAPPLTWIYVVGSDTSWDAQCQRLCDRIRNEAEWRRRHHPNVSQTTSSAWRIHVVDYRDPPDLRRCREAERLMGEQQPQCGQHQQHVFYSKRSVVQGRRWNASWTTPGRLVVTGPGNATYRHIPYPVRTDTVEAIRYVLAGRGLTLRDRIESMAVVHRPVDVTHLWPTSDSTERGGVGGVASRLRDLVSDSIVRASSSSSTSSLHDGDKTRRNWTVVSKIVGSSAREGRRSVATSYVEAMLSTKIMVVTQRDNWEGHYRLMEALVSGALVFTDQMLSLPSGLANGTSVIEFGSVTELTRLLDYFLSHPLERQRIAGEGRRIAMSRHRSWHRVEEVIFGKPLTVCPEIGGTDYDPDCPFVVHANESYSITSSLSSKAVEMAQY